MSVVAEAKVVITGSDHTGAAFDSIARKVEALGKTTKKVGDAAGSIGKIAAEVDKISASVGRSSAAVDRFAGVLKVAGEASSGIGKIAANVDKAASTMPRLTADANNMAKAMASVTAAEKALAAETDRIGKAGSKLTLFKELQGDLKGARATMNQAQRELAGFTRAIEERDARIAKLRTEHVAATEAQNAAARGVTAAPSRADAADKALFDAKMQAHKASGDAYKAAIDARKDVEKVLADALNPKQGEKLARQQADAAKAADLSRSAYDMQRGAVKALKTEIEGLAGPMVSTSSIERRLLADAENATRAFDQQGAAATRAGEAVVRAIAREEEARARQAQATERWMRQYRALEARAGGQHAALAPRASMSAVEALAAARRRPASQTASSALAREASSLARAQLDLAAFREVQATVAELRRAAREAQAEAVRVGRDVKAARNPSPELLADHARAGEAASSANAAFERQAGVLKALRADIEGVIGPMHSLASAEAQMASRASAADATLKRQEARHKRLHAAREMAEDVLPFEGPEVLHLTREAYHEGAMLQHERVGLQNAGRTPEQIEEIEQRSREVSAALPTATSEENLKIVAETTGAFGSLDHALEHLQFMQRTMSILHTAAGDKIHEGPGALGRYLAKFFEDRQKNPEEFEHEMKTIIPAMVATGGVFNPREMYMFAQQAKSSLPNYDSEFISKYMPALIARSDGEKTGTAANAFTNTITGKARDGKQAAAWLKLGLLDPTMLTPGSKGPVGWSAGAVKHTDLALANPVRWAEEVLIPAMKSHGIDTNDRMAVTKQLATMFRNNTANFFANEIAQAVSLALLHKDAGLYGQVGSDEEIYKRNLHEDPTVALSALGTAISTFAGNVTSPVMKDVANVLGNASEGIAHLGKAVADFDAAHPQIAKAIAGGTLGGGLAVGGLLTSMLFTNLKGLLSGGASTAAATEMVAAGSMQVRAGEMMLAAAGKGGLGLPGAGDLPGGFGPVKEAEKDAAGWGKKLLPTLSTLGRFSVYGAVFGAIAGIMLGRDQSKSLVDGGHPDVQPQDNNLGLPGLDNDPDFVPATGLRKGWWKFIGRKFGRGGFPTAGVPLPPMRPADLAPLSADPMPAVMPIPVADVPAHTLPPAAAVSGAPVPVAIVSAPASLPPMSDRWLDGDRVGIEERSRRGRDAFLRDHEGTVGQRMMEHAAPLSDLKATVEGPITAQVSGSAEVTVKVVVEASSSLIQAAASGGRASMPLTSGSTGGVGVQRTSANPQYGTNGGAGRGPR